MVILYPEPPLGAEELRILNEIDRDIKFITPILLPTLSQMTKTEKNISGISENLSKSIAEQKLDKKNIEKSMLNGKRIAISVSESEEIANNWDYLNNI